MLPSLVPECIICIFSTLGLTTLHLYLKLTMKTLSLCMNMCILNVNIVQMGSNTLQTASLT